MKTYRFPCNCERQQWVGTVEWKSDGTLMVVVDCSGIHQWPGCHSPAEVESARVKTFRLFLEDLIEDRLALDGSPGGR